MNEGECDIGCTQTQHKIALNRPCPPNPLQREILCRPLTYLFDVPAVLHLWPHCRWERPHAECFLDEDNLHGPKDCYLMEVWCRCCFSGIQAYVLIPLLRPLSPGMRSHLKFLWSHCDLGVFSLLVHISVEVRDFLSWDFQPWIKELNAPFEKETKVSTAPSSV